MRWLVAPLLMLLLVAHSSPARAQNDLTLAPSTIAVTSENGSPFATTFFLTPNAPMASIDFVATDLAPERAEQRPILGTQVTFSPTALQYPEPRVRHQVLVTVANVTGDGTWMGEVLIRWRSAPSNAADATPEPTHEITAPLVVTSTVDPVLTLETPPTVVAAGERGILAYRAPDVVRRVTIHSADDQTAATGLSVYVPDLQSPDQRAVFPGSAIETAILSASGTPIADLPSGQRADVLVTFHPDAVPAGSYAGSLTLQSANAADVPLPVAISVKDWWLLPLAALLLGLGISYGITYYRTRIKVKDELRVRIVRMQHNRAESADFGKHVGPYVDGRLTLAESHLRNDKPAEAEPLVSETETLWNTWLLNRHLLLPLIAQLEDEIRRTDGQTDVKVIVVRTAMIDSRDTGLHEYVDDPAGLRDKIETWRTALDGLLPALRRKIPALGLPTSSLPPVDFWDWRQPSQRLKLFAWTVGLIGFLLLAWAGMQELYLNNATFGAAGIVDYMKLFIWGFGIEATRAQIVTFLQGERRYRARDVAIACVLLPFN